MKKILTLVVFMLAISPLFGQNSAYTVTKNGNMGKLTVTEGYTLEYRIYDINSDPNGNGGQNEPNKQATIAKDGNNGPDRQIQWNISNQVIDIRYMDDTGNWTEWAAPEIE